MKSMRLAAVRRMRAIGWTAEGIPLYPIRGAEGDENEGGDGNDEGGSEGSSGGGTGGGSTEEAAQALADATAELDTLRRRLSAADKAKGAAEQRLNEIDSADKSELEKAQGELKKLMERAEKAEQAALEAKLSIEILKFPGFVWHDPDAVLRLIDTSAIEVDAESGKVTGVKDALTKLAKDKAYLLKGKPDAGKDGSGGGGKPSGTNGASGNNPGNQTPDDKNKRRQELADKYKL